MDFLMCSVVVGSGATLATDLWAIIRNRVLGVPMPNYALVGRWIAHLARGRFRHDRIAASRAVPAEHLIGWITHFAVGIGFAAILLGTCGVAWVRSPTVVPALIVGIATVAAPFLVMQPGMGAGIAASRTPNPSAARLQSLVTHTIFGLGLYGTGWLVSLAWQAR